MEPSWESGGWGYGGGLPARNDKGVGAPDLGATAYRYIVKGIFNRLADWLGMTQPDAPTSQSYQHFNGMPLGMKIQITFVSY